MMPPPINLKPGVEVIELDSDDSSSDSDIALQPMNELNKSKRNNVINDVSLTNQNTETENSEASDLSNSDETHMRKISGNEPPCKKLKIPSTPTNVSAKFDITKISGSKGFNFYELLVLVLKNVESATVSELWNFLCYLFPIYGKEYNNTQGAKKIRRVIAKKDLFLRTGLEKNKNLVMLNPLKKEMHHEIILRYSNKQSSIVKEFFKPELWKFLLEGSLNLKGEMKSSIEAPVKDLYFSRKSNDFNPVIQNLEVVVPSEEASKLPTLDFGNLNSVSPMSDDSNDTVIFEPQIINCRTLTGADSEIFFSDNDESITKQADNNHSILGQLVDVTYVPNVPNSGMVSFANTVWSNDDKMTEMKESVPVVVERSTIQSFPEIDNCIPKWKRIFPWVVWIAETKILSCSICQSVCKKVSRSEVVIVRSLLNADEVFTVSRSLREHADTQSHSMAMILEKKDIISILHFLLSFHFSEFSSVNDIILSFEGLMENDNRITNDTLKETIKMLGMYLEDKTLSCLRSSTNFSVITDPCCGLLIVKWLNQNDEPEEHIISSYMSITDKNPHEYLSSLDIDTSKIVAYISNARCEECSKCRLTQKVSLKSRTPLRLPQLDRYFIWLWRCKLLKPFYSLGCALGKLWFQFPHKFSDIQDRNLLNGLSKFSVNPEIFIKIFDQINTFKQIAENIYQLSGNLEALGLVKLNVCELSKLTNMFSYISAINMLLMQFKCEFPFSKNLDKILLKRNMLLEFFDDLKDKIKIKEVTIAGVQANDVDDVLKLIDLVIKEFQLPIYHKGRSVRVSFGRCSSYEYLSQYTNAAGVQNDFNILYTALRPSFPHDNTALLKSLCDLLKQHRHLEKKDTASLLNYFHKNPTLKLEHQIAYKFYQHAALLGFELSKVQLCLFEIRIYDLLFYQSAWSNIGANIKEYLLTITSELSGNNKLSEREMYLWWYKNRVQKFNPSIRLVVSTS